MNLKESLGKLVGDVITAIETGRDCTSQATALSALSLYTMALDQANTGVSQEDIAAAIAKTCEPLQERIHDLTNRASVVGAVFGLSSDDILSMPIEELGAKVTDCIGSMVESAISAATQKSAVESPQEAEPTSDGQPADVSQTAEVADATATEPEAKVVPHMGGKPRVPRQVEAPKVNTPVTQATDAATPDDQKPEG